MCATAQELAVEAAHKSDHDKWKLGSVLWRGGSLLSVGHNRVKNHPSVIEDEKYFHCTIHAEVDAIKGAGNPSGAKLFVARITRSGRLGLAKPCDRCMEVIREAGIRRIFYTCADGTWATMTPH